MWSPGRFFLVCLCRIYKMKRISSERWKPMFRNCYEANSNNYRDARRPLACGMRDNPGRLHPFAGGPESGDRRGGPRKLLRRPAFLPEKLFLLGLYPPPPTTLEHGKACDVK